MDSIDWDIFNELVLMDDDEPGFSKSLIQTFIEQATQTFTQISEELAHAKPDLNKLSQYGHFLKGSAASLGMFKIQEQCERIQNYGLQKDFDDAIVDGQWTAGIQQALERAREEFVKAREELGGFYNEVL